MEAKALNRREWMRALIGIAITATTVAARRRGGLMFEPSITVYKDPNCGCCKKWISHLEANGFKATAHDRTDMNALKDSLGVPTALRSCHTAVVGKLIVEGHVPAADIRTAMRRLPKGMIGLAVPGMPSGSPGMEMGDRTDRYDVVAFGAKGETKVFTTHR